MRLKLRLRSSIFACKIRKVCVIVLAMKVHCFPALCSYIITICHSHHNATYSSSCEYLYYFVYTAQVRRLFSALLYYANYFSYPKCAPKGGNAETR